MGDITMKICFLIFLILFSPDIFCQGANDILSGKQENAVKQELIEQFKAVATSGELQRLLEDNGTFNVEFPTLGGEKFWDTFASNGWKLQVNIISGWWRILDANDNRVARGTTAEQLESLLKNRPTSVLVNYLDKGFRFIKTPATRQAGSAVVLIHGWGVRASSMQRLADTLAQKGFDTFNYDYPTAECKLERHCQVFLSKFRELLGELPKDEKIYFLTHSMGGLVLRGAMAKMTEEECRRISAIVMLGPPNRGSNLAYFGKMPFVSSFNASLQDMSPDDASFVSKIPEPVWLPPVGIIAGRYDGKVALEDTRLPSPLPYKHTIVDCTHPGLRDPPNVIKQILNFFKESFKN